MEVKVLKETLPSGVVTYHWPCPQSKRATLVFQHGFGDYSERWVRDYPFFIRDLHAKDIDVWSMDMWGHGDSPGSRSITHVGKAIKDHITLREKLADKTYSPLILLGHSLGGLVTAGSASEVPSNVAGVILLAPALPDHVTPFLRSLVWMASKVFPSQPIFLKAADPKTLSRNEALLQRWESDPKVFHGQISYQLAASALSAAAEMWPRLPEWRPPLLLVHGEEDTYTQHDQSLKFMAQVAAEKKEFYSVVHGRHDLFSDVDADVTWKYVLDWIDRLVDSLNV